jgi:anti-sigma factor RsiW
MSSTGIRRRIKGWALRTLPYMATCEELEDFIIDYVDETLPDSQNRKFDLHLRVCAPCRRYIENYRKTIALTNASYEDVPPPDGENIPEELVQAILAARDEKP